MGRVERQKRQLIEEANKRNLGILKEGPIRRDITTHEEMRKYGRNTKWWLAMKGLGLENALETYKPITVYINDDDTVKIACDKNDNCYDQLDRMVSKEEAAQMLGVESLDDIGYDR